MGARMGDVTPSFKEVLDDTRDALERDRVAARSGGWCEARLAGVCRGKATMNHHVRLRSRGGTNSAANLLHVCGWCHAYIHDHPRLSRELGFIR
jgi:hypothetical protein